MEITEMIEKVVSNVKSDPNLLQEFKADPEKTIEKITGADLPDGIVDKVTEAIKGEGGDLAKMFDTIKDKVGGEEGVEKLIDSVEEKVGGSEGGVGGLLDSLKKML